MTARLVVASFVFAAAAFGQVQIDTTSPLPDGQIGVAYSQGLAASGGTTPYTWSATGLPAGLDIAPSTGVISGTPTASGPFTVEVTLTDSTTPTALTANKSFSLTIAPATLVISTASPLPGGQVGVTYNQTLAASGGTPGYTWSGTAPAGLTLSAGGVISGTPNASGTFNFTVTVTDSTTATANKSFALTITPATLIITTASPLPGGQVGVTYNQTLAASGGTPGYTWSGTAPAGLTLSPAGVISGTPNATGTFNFTVTVTDSTTTTANKSFALTIAPATLVISTASPLPGGQVGVTYNQTLAASGGTPGYTWSGTAPAGLTLSAGGVISGTPSASGTFNFTVTVTDSTTTTANKSFALTIAPATLIITTASPLPGGQVGTAYNQTLAASGGTPGYTWSGTAPAGLTLSSGGVISGTPNAFGTFNFTVTVTDSASVTANKSFALTITPATLVISTSSPLPGGQVGATYNQTLAASGGTPGYTWSGTAPAGLTLSAGGVISGTPNASGTFNFTVTVTDSASVTANKSFAVTIVPAALSITTASLPSGQVGAAYSQAVAGTGGTPPYTWSATGLPGGLTIAASTGVISGTPTASGPFTVGVTLRDSTSVSVNKSIPLSINPASLGITTTSLPAGQIGIAYTQTLVGSGGTPPYTWSATGLPAGLTLAATTGVISGTPTGPAGSFTVAVTLTDSASVSTPPNNLTLIINPATLNITTASPLPDGQVGIAYSRTLAGTGGTQPYAWSATGLPPGLSLAPATGVISGTPSTGGVFTAAVTLRDNAGVTANKSLSITINSSTLAVTTSSLPVASAGAAYDQTLAATGGTTPYTWSLTAAAPPGLTLASNGRLTGTPTAAGNFTVAVRVTDVGGATADRSLPLRVTDALALTTCPAETAVVGQSYLSSATAAGGSTPYTWSVPPGQLPIGIVLNQSAGAFTGTPTQSGNYAFTLSVTGATGGTAARQCRINVLPALAFTTKSLADGVQGVPYLQPLTATGGQQPYRWYLALGEPPAGLTLDTAGAIRGTPTGSGKSTFRLGVEDSLGLRIEADYSITIRVGLAVTACATPTASVGQAYSSKFSVSGGTAPYAWSVSGGTLPAGLALDAGTGTLAGTPTAAGTSNFAVRVADQGGTAATRDCSIQVLATLAIGNTPLAGGILGVTYSDRVTATGGVTPYRWSLPSGALPPGLSLNEGTGQITGTPSNAGTFRFTMRVTDAANATKDGDFTITVTTAFAISACPTPAATVGQPYASALNAVGGQSPYAWSLGSGTLPSGLTLNGGTGVITGTPAQPGNSEFTLAVTDSANVKATRGCNISVVSANLSITTPSALPAATLNTPYQQTLSASGGRAPYTWSVIDGALPAGLQLTAAGSLEGTPTSAVESRFTVRVTDADRAIAQQLMTLKVTAAAPPEVTFVDVPDIATPGSQFFPSIQIGSAYPVDLTGTLSVSFTPDPGLVDDPAIQFAAGGRSVPFTIPAGQTKAVFANGGNGLQSGTVAGQLQLSYTLQGSGVDLTPPSPIKQLRVDRLAPRIASVRVATTSDGFQLEVTGFSTTREVTQGTFRFTPASGSALTQSEVTVPLTDAARAWFSDAASTAFGSQFTLTMPFRLQGARLSSVSVTLTNGQGTSPAVVASF